MTIYAASLVFCKKQSAFRHEGGPINLCIVHLRAVLLDSDGARGEEKDNDGEVADAYENFGDEDGENDEKNDECEDGDGNEK